MRKHIVGATLAIALVMPSGAAAAAIDLAGNVRPDGNISMTVKKKHGNYKVVKLTFSGVPITCDGGDSTVGANTTGYVFKVRHNGKFAATLVPTDPNHHNSLKIIGKLTHKGHKATGTLRLHGDGVVTQTAGTQDGCDTGTDDWSAKAA